MAARAILLGILTVFVLAAAASADDAPTLPSRNANIVIPLLKAFSPKDGYARIVKILGEEDVDTGDALKDCTYGLSDGSGIRVRSDGDKVYSIFWQKPGIHDIQVIFAADKTWEH